MSRVGANVDTNMNKTNVNNLQKVQFTPTPRDPEKARAEGGSSTPWPKIIFMILALGALVAWCAVAWVFQGWETSLWVFFVLLFIYFIVYFHRFIYIACRTAPRDLTALYCYFKILRLAKAFTKKHYSMPDIFHDRVVAHPNKICFYFEDETWTFQQVEEYSLRVSAVMKAHGIKKGTTVAVMMSNCPEMPAVWLGVARLGGISPLINTNQTGSALIHSIVVAKCDVVIYGSEYESAIQDVRKDLSPTLKMFKFTRRPLNTVRVVDASNDIVKVVDHSIDPVRVVDGVDAVKIVDNTIDLTTLLENTSPDKWTQSDSDGFHCKLLYIYTSGTTGLPKAAVISPSKMLFLAAGVHYLGGMNPKDVMYCPMPLYHSAGGCISMGQALIFGCTVALRSKFSATSYFPDCIKYNATCAHYIGEMCRYILATRPSPVDTQHKVRTVYGNGMRPQIWLEFVKRFNIKSVAEFYGATEGNANILNIDSKPGAIGFVSRIIPAVYPISIIKVDMETGEPIRNKKGFCQVAKANEPGVFVGKIIPDNPARQFLGYVDKEASDKKVVRDVFKRGDSAFISGDILISDEFGYLYFLDRTGDTFRWRGENVSTTEVESSISRVSEQRDAVVYGVQIPNTEGRAGMCAIADPDGTLDLEKLNKDLAKEIPKYARPVFIRVLASVESHMTGTYKMKKTDLQKEGYNPAVVKDKLYYLDLKLDKYVPLTSEEFAHITSGAIRL